MKRVLALLAAVAMVAVSLYVRAGWDDDDTPGQGSPDGGGGQGDGPLRVVCATELEAACDALEGEDDVDVEVEDAGKTLERLEDGGELDVWIAPAPWPEMAEVEARADFFGESQVVARTPLMVAVDDQAVVCRQPAATWRCTGDAVRQSERVGWRDPASTGVGRLALGAAMQGFYGDREVSRAELGGEFRGWQRDLVEGAEVHRSPLERIVLDAAFLDVAVTTEAEVAALRSSADPRRLGRLEFLYPEPVVTVDAVLVPVGRIALPEELAATVTEALTAERWRTTDGAPPEAAPDVAPALPTGTNLPNPGVLVALAEELQ